MRKLILILFLAISTCSAFAQGDAVIHTGIGINGAELINIIRDEPCVRFSIEQRFLKHYAVLLEYGVYYESAGYNFRAEIKRYDIFNSKNPGTPNYIGLVWTTKNHFYKELVNFYADSSQNSTNAKPFNITREAYTYDLVIGWVILSRHFYLDGYLGAGVRFKKIGGITPAYETSMEDNAGLVDLIPGHHVLPDFTVGIRLGVKR